MTMSRIRLSIFLSITLVSAASCSGSVVEAPQREGRTCWVKVRPDPAGALREIIPGHTAFASALNEAGISVSHTAYVADGGMYIQFAKECDRKGVIARQLMSSIYGEHSQRFVYLDAAPRRDELFVAPDAAVNDDPESSITVANGKEAIELYRAKLGGDASTEPE